MNMKRAQVDQNELKNEECSKECEKKREKDEGELEDKKENIEKKQTVDSEVLIFEKYQYVKDYLSDYETRNFSHYVAYKETNDFKTDVSLESIIAGEKQPKLRWEYRADNDLLPIPFTGSPYIMLGKQEYYCHQGDDFNAKKKQKRLDQKNESLKKDHVWKKKRNLTQPTKKMKCPVKFAVKKIFRFTEYKLDKDSKNNREKLNKQVRKDLLLVNKDCKNKGEKYGSLQYLLVVPNEDEHKFHNVGQAASFIQPVDEKVTEYVKKQIREGCRRPKDIQSRVEYFVKETFFEGKMPLEARMKKFVPSRKKIRNLILSVRNETRYSKIDQENIEELKKNWRDYGDVIFEPFLKKTYSEEKRNFESEAVDDLVDDEYENDKDIDYEELISDTTQDSTDGKMMFIYQSNEMKRLYRIYGNSLILLDATYKTTKYALPLFFLVVKTNVNFQVAAVIVIQEETTDMISKALTKVKLWNPEVTPKYAFVDFDEREISSLENVFPNIKVFICDFHREQAWHRWVNKKDNGVSHVADQVKIFLRRIAHCTTDADCQIAVRDFMKYDQFNGRLKVWFTNIWLPHIKRWSLAYRPDDLILCNTNNGTERLNEDLKYDELDGYKNCSLSELLCVIINSFIPKHYMKYIELNVRFSDGYKKYATGVPDFLKNRPKKVVDILLEKMYRVTSNITITKAKPLHFKIKSPEEGTGIVKEYELFLGDSSKFCRCSCRDFRRYRMLCKHFFAVFNSGQAQFDELSPLLLNHPYMVLDKDLFNDNMLYQEEIIKKEPPTIVTDSFNPITELNPLLPELPQKKSQLKSKKINIRGNLKNLIDLTFITNDDEIIQDLDEAVAELLNNFLEKINKGNLPLLGGDMSTANKDTSNDIASENVEKKVVKGEFEKLGKRKSNHMYKDLHTPKVKKHPFSKRVGSVADMMKQFYRAKVELPVDDDPIEDNIIIDHVFDEGEVMVEKVEEERFLEKTIVEENIEVDVDKKTDDQDVKLVKTTTCRNKSKYRLNSKFSLFIQQEITGDEWLSDDTINLCQLILHEDFPLTKGLEDTNLGSLGLYSVQKGAFIQILFDNNHWVVVSAPEDGARNIVYLYNSLQKSSLSRGLSRQICKIRHCLSNNMQVIAKPVQQQMNARDCGVFSVAFAIDLAHKKDPDTRSYDTSQMRSHLLECLKSRKMVPFPSTTRRVKRSSKAVYMLNLYCLCRDTFFKSDPDEDKGSFMICCTVCEEWYHKKCERVPARVFHDDKIAACWKCSKCKE